MQAKTLLEDAKTRLWEPRLLEKEIEALNSTRRSFIAERDEIARIEARTKTLEMQAELLSRVPE
ncbi:hypothetical protein AGDE_02681 [Angomonas deanei]|nr:hypothetical protein AGDE_02681 [Angomonas deanei]|eukprot:EPY41244.1 hypothetical protein AGDE_02681 [Angomonas deanei]